MKKKLISLTERQADYLDTEAKRLGISVSELVRRILDIAIGPPAPGE
jgi:hypothetical protein